MWSSPQRKSFIALHAQWVDEAYEPRKALLGLPNLRRSHIGAAMAPHLMSVIQKFDLAQRLGYFTGNNDIKNDTCLRHLAEALLRENSLYRCWMFSILVVTTAPPDLYFANLKFTSTQCCSIDSIATAEPKISTTEEIAGRTLTKSTTLCLAIVVVSPVTCSSSRRPPALGMVGQRNNLSSAYVEY
ncbi:hypothetical protein MY4038_003039 [Beauveria bassiana]